MPSMASITVKKYDGTTDICMTPFPHLEAKALLRFGARTLVLRPVYRLDFGLPSN